MKVAFDIGGVISKYPSQFRSIIVGMIGAGHEVFIITDMKERQTVLETLRLNEFDFVPEINVYQADYDTHGEACKARLLDDLEIDLFFDDFIGYVAIPGKTIRCLVMPNAELPYWHDDWKTIPGTPEFGRKVFKR